MKKSEFERQKQIELDMNVRSIAFDQMRSDIARLREELKTEMRLKYTAYLFILRSGYREEFLSFASEYRGDAGQGIIDWACSVEMKYLTKTAGV